MILIIGGAYQGKLEYALDRFNLTEDDVFFCKDEETAMPLDKKIVCNFDLWILALLREGRDVHGMARQFIENNGGAIVICNDISGGVVPVDALFRKWRESLGRLTTEMAQQSDEVIRLFCGIATQLK